MRTALLCIVLGLFLMPVSVEAQTVTFRQQVVVDGNEVTLGALAKVSPAGDQARYLSGLTLASSPAPGKELRLQSRDLQNKLRRLEPQRDLSFSGAEVITIRRAGIMIGQEKVRRLLEQYLDSQRHRLPPAQISFAKLQLPAPFILPKGMVRTEIHPSDPNILNSRSFNMIFRVNDKVVKNLSVRGHLEARIQVATVAYDLPRGAILNRDTIHMVEKDIVSLRHPFMSPDQLLGKKLKRSLRQGAILTRTMIDTPPVVKRGEVVMISLKRAGMAMSAKGIAKKNGEAGDTIPVRNSNSQREILCKIIGPGQVTVGF